MAEVLAVGAGVIAIIQITDRIIGLCKIYIETVRDIPSDLRSVLIEASMLKTIFENLKFLMTNSEASSAASTLFADDGPVEGCRRSITELEKLFPSDCIQSNGQNGSKKRRVKASLEALAWPLKANKARKLLEEIKGYKATIALALTTESIQDIKYIKSKTSKMHNILTDSQRHEVYRWLLHTDPSSLHHRAQTQYEQGTGGWMLRSPEWANWLAAERRCLWIHGIPGAGKTVLMSYLIEQIKRHCGQSQKEQVAYVYYYFYYGHNQDEAVPFLRWLLNQLCRQADFIPDNVYKMYKYGGEPSIKELLEALEDVLDNFKITYVIVDAIDESNPRENLLKVLRNLVTDPRFKKLQLLASSREYIDIERVMEEFSVSVSMSNPFVEEDIRLRVRSTLQSDPKFRRWPQELLDEVENAVSTGAKGMFRWAVCQLDVLRRLICERTVVKKALANLPETLDETYDRIFLTIPEEDCLVVSHALQWIMYHNQVYHVTGEVIPFVILLQAVEKSTAASTDHPIERFYDIETFRELCGCLISITPEYRPGFSGEFHRTTSTVSFAHYTVKEYLDSTRISKNSTAYLTAWKKNLQEKFMEITLSEAHYIKRNELWERKDPSNDSSDVFDAVEGNCNIYCMVSALLLLANWPSIISQQNTLSTFAIDLLDPSKPNFASLSAAAWRLEESMKMFSRNGLDHSSFFFWDLRWNPRPTDVDAVHLSNISFMARYLNGNRSSAVVKKFLQIKETHDFLQTQLSFRSKGLFYGEKETIIHGSIIEIFAQIDSFNNSIFELLLEYGSGLFDLSKVLLLHIGQHFHELSCEESCLVERLLELGANPNSRRHQVTTLQIAVVCLESEATNMLLKAGADPNDTGNTDGIFWGEGEPMSRFKCLRHVSPLKICRDDKFRKKIPIYLPFHGSDIANEERKIKIEELLIRYGAEE